MGTSTMEELFTRRHVRWSPQLQPILSLLHVSRAALFRYLSICSDDDLVKLRQVAAAVSLSLAQTQSMNTSMGLLSLSKHYGIHSNDSADDTGMSEPGYTRTVPYIPASVRTSSALGGRANSLPSLNSKRSSKVSPTGGLPRTSSGKAVEFKSRVQTSLPSGLRSPLLRQWLLPPLSLLALTTTRPLKMSPSVRHHHHHHRHRHPTSFKPPSSTRALIHLSNSIRSPPTA